MCLEGVGSNPTVQRCFMPGFLRITPGALFMSIVVMRVNISTCDKSYGRANFDSPQKIDGFIKKLKFEYFCDIDLPNEFKTFDDVVFMLIKNPLFNMPKARYYLINIENDGDYFVDNSWEYDEGWKYSEDGGYSEKGLKWLNEINKRKK